MHARSCKNPSVRRAEADSAVSVVAAWWCPFEATVNATPEQATRAAEAELDRGPRLNVPLGSDGGSLENGSVARRRSGRRNRGSGRADGARLERGSRCTPSCSSSPEKTVA
ncbi:hypothetical protein MRX96_021393 [Rhipicephalus microplus]